MRTKTFLGEPVDPLRSKTMSHIRSKNTGPELALRSALRREGVRFKTYPNLPGHPDLIIPVSHTAIFVHGCFWHGCPRHYRAPRMRSSYWSKKVLSNRRRDGKSASTLRARGWSVMTIWECQIARDLSQVMARIQRVSDSASNRKRETQVMPNRSVQAASNPVLLDKGVLVSRTKGYGRL